MERIRSAWALALLGASPALAQLASGAGRVMPMVNALATSKSGYTTYQVSADFSVLEAADVYAVFGEQSRSCTRAEGLNCHNLRLPPAFQVPIPFGTNTGPTNPAFFAVNPDTEFDSFITIGMDGPATTQGAISSIGIDFSAWTEQQGIDTADGAVFFMDPGAPARACCLAYLFTSPPLLLSCGSR